MNVTCQRRKGAKLDLDTQASRSAYDFSLVQKPVRSSVHSAKSQKQFIGFC